MHTPTFPGHTIRQVLVVFPLGLLASAVVFDFLRLVSGNAAFGDVSYWMLASGLAGGSIGAILGWVDWFSAASTTRAKGIVLLHSIVNTIVLLLYGAGLFSRANSPGKPEILAIVFSTMGAGVALAGGWIGDELVVRKNDPLPERSDLHISLGIDMSAIDTHRVSTRGAH